MATSKHADGEPKHEPMSVEVSAAASPERPLEPSPTAAPEAAAVLSSIPSFAAASELLSAPYSCLVLNTHRRHVCLPPMYLGRKSLKGVPLAYDNIRILGQYGDIVDDGGYVHMDVIADFIVFQPQKGQKLLGKVNKLGVSHVGCLVHGCFNASIPKPNLVPMETWRDAGPRIGADLEFEVTTLDADAVGVLLIRGRLDRTSTAPDQLQPDTEENGDLNPDSTDESAVKKKKKKKKKNEEQEEEVTDPASVQLDAGAADLNETVDGEQGSGGKKKRKKDKRLKQEEVEQEVPISAVEVHGSDSSGYQSDKPSKKRTREPAADVTSAGDGPEPKRSKKSKSRVEQFA
uniref:DNA-directed RNA polymerase subunit n=1 Tax=Tetraodon nigroviridis TaxID=99883 RepID=H3BX99_TETNG